MYGNNKISRCGKLGFTKLHELSGEGSLKEFSNIKSIATHLLIQYMTEKNIKIKN